MENNAPRLYDVRAQNPRKTANSRPGIPHFAEQACSVTQPYFKIKWHIGQEKCYHATLAAAIPHLQYLDGNPVGKKGDESKIFQVNDDLLPTESIPWKDDHESRLENIEARLMEVLDTMKSTSNKGRKKGTISEVQTEVTNVEKDLFKRKHPKMVHSPNHGVLSAFRLGFVQKQRSSSSRGESHTPSQGFKQLARRLRSKFKVYKNLLSLENLQEASIIIFGCPREKFSTAEIDNLRSYVSSGGSVIFLSKEGGDIAQNTNLNDLTQEYGITINSDGVFSGRSFCGREYNSDPRCELFSSFNNNNRIISRFWEPDDIEYDNSRNELRFLYPYGTTLSVQKPATTILSSGFMSQPVQCSIGALWQGTKGKGRVAVTGSVAMFEDVWLDKEDNATLSDFVFLWLYKEKSLELEKVNIEEPDARELEQIPNTEALANRLRCCLQEADDIPKDFTQLLDNSLFKYHTDLIPETGNLYRSLGVKHAPLTLIAPQFETPLPPLQPAVFSPVLKEPKLPEIDLFDLDDCFASPCARLAQLTNKESSFRAAQSGLCSGISKIAEALGPKDGELAGIGAIY
ncbi:intraflagellar transport protein 52 homolog [Selaginella moellendorffii]|uniref:intraflagellar transport protein 52 homolog n=1 Tax=Selaginella moellendorffii TaxID=88036 RepID=UPI000D1C633F|nr:intraflagellar transport protein 52 homolog [Selaginella moellendorffii]|eukprot:XP_024532412.1 intraflagellar transport protein 52 homolog [Selaginella moellendorffii]